jgi:predicted nucleic acid-binding Zn ribbon protein
MTLYRRSPRAVASALAPLREEWTPETLLAEIQRAWPSAVGPAIAAAARPVSERAGVLTVACESAAWAQELDLIATVILEPLNAGLRRGRITRLKCVSGR